MCHREREYGGLGLINAVPNSVKSRAAENFFGLHKRWEISLATEGLLPSHITSTQLLPRLTRKNLQQDLNTEQCIP